jgi:hypothetical protein
MDQVVRERVRAWKDAMDADNERVLEEKRKRTPAARMRLLQAFLAGHGQIGLERRKPESGLHRMPYSEVQERLRARYPERFSRY